MTPLSAAFALALQVPTISTVPPASILPEDQKPSYRMLSAPECVHWAAARKGTSEESEFRFFAYRMWVLGYVTGFNVVGPDLTGDLLDGGSQEELFKAVDGYCARNPSNYVEAAMRPIAAAYLRRRQANHPPDPSLTKKGSVQVVATVSCKDWAASSDLAIIRLAYTSLVHGYVTAYNRWGPDPIGDAVPDDRVLIARQVDKWCANRSAALMIGAIDPLMRHVASERAAGRMPGAGQKPHDQVDPASRPRK